MSTTASPVTQRDDVAVNMQVKKSVETPFLEDIGNDNKKVPIVRAIKKLPIMTCVEFILNIFITSLYYTIMSIKNK